MTDMSSFKARLVLDDLEREVGGKMNWLRRFADEMDAIDAAIEEKRRELAAAKQELAGLHQEVGAKRRELEGLFAEIRRMTGKLGEEQQARKDWVA
jgi:chromosome segregation ATPase